MNERIKELAKQAYRQDCLENNPNWKEGVAFERFMGLMDSTFEKFAELIVQECINIVEDSRIEGDEGVCLVEATKWKIKHHFGVEQ